MFAKILSRCPRKDLTSKDDIREILQFETGEKGNIYAMWMEYLEHAFSRINDKTPKKSYSIRPTTARTNAPAKRSSMI